MDKLAEIVTFQMRHDEFLFSVSKTRLKTRISGKYGTTFLKLGDMKKSDRIKKNRTS